MPAQDAGSRCWLEGCGVTRGLRLEEKWAQTVLARAISVPVEQNDDGSKAGMPHLTFIRGGAREIVEVTAAANGDAIELWNFLEGGETWTAEQLQGGWSVELIPVSRGRRTKNFRGELESLLGKLEMLRIPLVDRDHPAPPELANPVIVSGSFMPFNYLPISLGRFILSRARTQKALQYRNEVCGCLCPPGFPGSSILLRTRTCARSWAAPTARAVMRS